ncbi:MAG: peptide deformylase [Elusimicrobiota bacterium]|jgi:peptide deformylase|nr:peptide deformylase [Elusimicrobiota bacterium]
MAVLKIIKFGDAKLRKKTAEITDVNREIVLLVMDMFETMYAAPGVGLAAPQVGVSKKLCVIDVSPEKNRKLVLINPVIIKKEIKAANEEGCLSFPGIYEDVMRFEEITVKFLDIRGQLNEVHATGLLAKAIQHEVDHLNARLLIDHLPDWKRKNIEKDIRRKIRAGKW